MKALLLTVVLCCPLATDGAIRVTDDRGDPVSGARVEYTVLSRNPTFQMLPARSSGVTDANGRLDLYLPVGPDLLIFVDHPAFSPFLRELSSPRVHATLQLDTGRTWKGAVAGTTEVRDGRICASGTLAHDESTFRWRRCGAIGDGGTFQLSGLPEGPVAADVQVTGYLPFRKSVDPSATPVLTLERGVLVSGRVASPRGHPVRGATCHSREGAFVVADPDGRFVIAVPELPATVTVRAEGFKERQFVAANPDELVARLSPAEQIYGHLLAFDGSAIVDAVIWIEAETTSGTRRSSRQPIVTDAEGRFTVDLPGPGTFTLRFEARGYQPATLRSIYVERESASPVGVIALNPGAGVRGIVTSGLSGEPLPGALVEVLSVGPLLLHAVRGGQAFAGVADENGAFVVSGLPIGRYLLRVGYGGLAVRHELVDLPRQALEDVGIVTLDRGATLTGRVTDTVDTPRGGVQVRFFDPAHELMTPLLETVTDEAGAYQLSAVAPGRYRAQVRSDRVLMEQEVDVSRGDVRIDLAVSGTRMRGWVTRGGMPVRGGTLRVQSALDPARRQGKFAVTVRGRSLAWGMPESTLFTTVGDDGAFVLRDVPVGLVHATYQGLAGEPIVRAFTIPSEPEVSVAFDVDGLPLEGRVTEEGTGVGLAATVRVSDREGRSLARMSTDPQGWYRFLSLESGVYQITATAPGFEPFRTSVQVTHETPQLVLPLRPGDTGTIAVTVQRDDGTGVAGVPISLFGLDGTLAAAAPSLDDGHRQFEGLVPDEYIVAWAEPLAGAGSARSVRAEPLRRASVDAPLTPGVSLVVACPKATCGGAPVELLGVRSERGLEMSPLLSGVTLGLRMSADGDLSLGRLSPGLYLVRLGVRGRTWEEEVTVTSHFMRIRFE